MPRLDWKFHKKTIIEKYSRMEMPQMIDEMETIGFHAS